MYCLLAGVSKVNWWKAAAEEIITGANKTISNLDERQVEKLIALVLEAKGRKIFIDGMGRSGFVASRGGLFDAANHGREGIHNSARKHVREQLHDISRWTCS